MQCTIYGRERRPLLAFLAAFDKTLFSLADGGPRFQADGIFLAGQQGERPYLLASGQNARHFRRFAGACLVTCGLSPKDTVSLSSVMDDRLVFSILRELPIIGGVREVQEIPARRQPFISEETAVLAAGLLLVCGMPPEKLALLPF